MYYYPYFTDERIEARKLHTLLNINATDKQWKSNLCMFDSQPCPFSGGAQAAESNRHLWGGWGKRETILALHPRQRTSIGSLGTVPGTQ